MLIGYVLLMLSATPLPVSNEIYSLEECESVKALILERRKVPLACAEVYL